MEIITISYKDCLLLNYLSKLSLSVRKKWIRDEEVETFPAVIQGPEDYHEHPTPPRTEINQTFDTLGDLRTT